MSLNIPLPYSLLPFTQICTVQPREQCELLNGWIRWRLGVHRSDSDPSGWLTMYIQRFAEAILLGVLNEK